jgi:hypothetical protein
VDEYEGFASCADEGQLMSAGTGISRILSRVKVRNLLLD